MSVHRTPHLSLRRDVSQHVSISRILTGWVAIVFLSLQMLAPSLASASNGEWIEICSEYGVTLKQIDLSEDESSPGLEHTDCEDCTFCAFAAPMSPPAGPEITLDLAVAGEAVRRVEPEVLGVKRYQWPESRGPPARTKNSNAERNSRAPMVTTFSIGGAPWT